MRNTIKTNWLIFRDGASKQNDTTERLDPSYVEIENRSMEELIQEAQKLAKELVFFDKNNQATGTWEPFLIEDPTTYYQASETGKASLRKQWASQLAAYVENPDRFLKDQRTKQKVSSPHTVLFLTFLKLLHHIKIQINGLTQKHLDFYYQERLGLSLKQAVPDMVNVLIELTEEDAELELKKGTVFLAGEDEEGNELQYTTTEDTIINKAKVAQLRNVFVDKKTFTIEQTHLHHFDTPDQGVSAMMQMALGAPNPGDTLPKFPEGFQEISELFIELDQNESVQQYIAEELFLSIEEFRLIFQKQAQEQNGTTADWKPIYQLLEEAYRRKKRFIRKDQLARISEEQGFTLLLKEVYGDPNPGDRLPNYRGQQVSFERLFADLKNPDLILQQGASEFIEETLKLKVPDFAFIMEISTTEVTNESWEEVYSLLENAERQVRRRIINPPTQEKILNIYAADDAEKLAFSEYNNKEESTRFKTFGNASHDMQSARLGFAVTSPVLLLKEGQRTIILYQQLGIDDESLAKLKQLIARDVLSIYLSGEDQWFAPKTVTIELGDYIKSSVGQPLSGVTIADNTLTITSNSDDLFESLKKDKMVIDTDGTIYRIVSDIADKSLLLDKIGKLKEGLDSITLFEASQVFVNAIRTEIRLAPEEQAVVGIEVPNTSNFIDAQIPSLAMIVNAKVVQQLNEQSEISVFDCLMDLTIKKVGLRVEVTGLQNIIIQNDQTTINPKKPFDPFGSEPTLREGLYFTNEEIAQKAITDLQLHPEWINQPEDFAAHYENYWKIEQDTLSPDDKDKKIKSNTDFTADVFVYHNFNELPVKDQLPLFPDDEVIKVHNIPALLQQTRPDYNYKFMPITDTDQSEVTDWLRYFKVELNGIDFQHTLYNDLFVKQALTTTEGIKELNVPSPYQPKLKSLQLSYTAETDILLEDGTIAEDQRLFHIHPFGYQAQQRDTNVSLFPQYQQNGALYIGISQCTPPQAINVLFQLAEGTADPDVPRPTIEWSYLTNEGWKLLNPSDLISDTTNGLLNSGIVRIRMPEDATTESTLFPDQFHWFRVSVAQHAKGIADTIAIKTQAVQAVLSNEEIATTHFSRPLQQESIRDTQQFIPQIKSISQPFTSSHGRPAEKGSSFNQRISQRLRHKNRALTMWDYEHLVLDAFPEVYKVKCLSAIKELGKIEITVVPDIRKSVPFHPFGPKVAANTLERIREFLDQRSPDLAEISVNNPVYLQVVTRCTVKFNLGVDAVFYKEKLIEEIKRFLSPWAFDDTDNIHLGGTLDAGVLVNFIAERPYVDFVANLKLFQSTDGEDFTDVTSLPHQKNAVIPDEPNMIIVSAANHFIDIVDENIYDEDAEKGINHMIIETDFEVAKDF
ncbi:baseplate J/gp47 family protein [Aquimarina mytili]|uniref:Baseplate J/gp47 family protein n=1 Tax=Aquimarina mytili TaxID=874423 RepID=A0A936ZSH8_9FLAO|nr:baseplate J/gp47 family protein [Aquimarina mytili]MBL0683868.1 baseplate J/gp47 family protein [Aquimarina mytili]